MILVDEQKVSVDILMAVYNGERYVAEQIQSILGQSYQNFRLIIRDDGSTDQTLTIVGEFVKNFPFKVFLIPSEGNVGVKENFSLLMRHSQNKYVMFSDQDDVWFKDKVSKTLSRMKQMEMTYGEAPILVHSDLAVVDDKLKMIDPSFCHYTNRKPSRAQTLNRLLVQNVVTGCTMMMNRKLVELSWPIPVRCLMHDWWIALVAGAFGKIAFIEEPLLFYRQHGKNTLGAQKFFNWQKIKKTLKHLGYDDGKQRDQTSLFFDRYASTITEPQKRMLSAYTKLNRNSWITKRVVVLKYRFFKNGFLRNLATFLLE